MTFPDRPRQVLPPRTLSHQPPFADEQRPHPDRQPLPDHRAGQPAARHTFVLGATARPNASAPNATSSSIPNADFIPIFSDDAFMHIKTFARAGTGRAGVPAGLGRTERPAHRVPIAETFDRRPPRPRRARGRAAGGRRGHRRGRPGQRPHRRHPPARVPIATTSRSSTRPRRSTPTSATSSTRPTPARSCCRTWSATRPSC